MTTSTIAYLNFNEILNTTLVVKRCFLLTFNCLFATSYLEKDPGLTKGNKKIMFSRTKGIKVFCLNKIE